MERIGDYSYTTAGEASEKDFMQRALMGLVRQV